MKKLMISLDKKLLDKNSRVAKRMVEYGKDDELFILIPHKEEKKFDLSENVYVHSTGGNKLKQYLLIKKFGRKVIDKKKIELITTQDPFFTGKVGVWLKKKTGVKLEVQLHGDFFSAQGGSALGGGGYYKNKNFAKYLMARFVLRRADKIRVVGKRIKASLDDLDIEDNRIEVRSITVNANKIKSHEPKIDLHQKHPGFDKIFLVLGRIEKVKNISWLIDVFVEVLKEKHCLLYIVGSGTEEQNIKLQITNYKLQENIKLQNWTEDPCGYLKTVDCVLFPSLSEGYGLVPMEANEIGTPVIMNNVGVANYELQPSEKVKILPINDKEAWIEAILSI